MLKAFTYMFKDFDWKNDLLPLWIMIFIAEFVINFAGLFSPIALSGKVTPIFYIILFLGFISTFVPCGYGMETLKNYLASSDRFQLPKIDVGKNFIKGLKFMLALFFLGIALTMILLILGIINKIFINTNISALSFLVVTLSCLVLIISVFLFLASVCKFAKTNDIFSFLRLSSLYKIINANVGKYFVGFVMFTVLIGIFCLIRAILLTYLIQRGFMLMLIYSLLISLISTYLALIFLYIFRHSVDPDLI
mgnify:CR=1 FL=1